MINNFDTDKQCFHFWKHVSAPIICIIVVRNNYVKLFILLLKYKNGQNEKRVKSRFFMKKCETFKKIVFQKVLQNGKNLSASKYFHGGNKRKRSF